MAVVAQMRGDPPGGLPAHMQPQLGAPPEHVLGGAARLPFSFLMSSMPFSAFDEIGHDRNVTNLVWDIATKNRIECAVSHFAGCVLPQREQ